MYLRIIILTFCILNFFVGWVEHFFANPMIFRKMGGFRYEPKNQALHSTHPTESVKCVCSGYL
jgi:hypothetical protein